MSKRQVSTMENVMEEANKFLAITTEKKAQVPLANN